MSLVKLLLTSGRIYNIYFPEPATPSACVCVMTKSVHVWCSSDHVLLGHCTVPCSLVAGVVLLLLVLVRVAGMYTVSSMTAQHG